MERFLVSALKYRPKSFESVVGQSAITSTLENAIKNNHLPQALLFTGPRGVGKTTCARILAKKINEENGLETDEDFFYNIFELDAASNNSVDDIRNLTEKVRISPQRGKYKVYIIDEVHMLSNQAFNAFLKTLEEPPEYAIFILATTEKHKVIPTILSRCQIYDFKRIEIDDIKAHLNKIANDQNIKADDDALHMIAQKADGALRDSLSIFDRVVSFCGNHLTRQLVAYNLDVLDYDYYFKMVDYFIKGDLSAALLEYNIILEKGFDGHSFITGLSSHFRDLLVAKDINTVQLLEVSQNVKQKYLQQSQSILVPQLIQFLEISNDCDIKYKTSKNKRLGVEIALMKMSSLLHENQGVKKKVVEIIPPPSQEVKLKNTEKKPLENKLVQNQTKSIEDKVQVAVPPIHQVQPVSEKRISSLSIESFTKERKVQTNQNQENLPKDIFTQENLNTVWKEYVEQAQQNKQLTSLIGFMSENIPVLLDDFKIQLTAYNDTLRKNIGDYKMDIEKFLRKQLNNYSIVLDIQVKELEKTSKHIYTVEEKYNFLVEKYPKVLDFTRKLGLRLE